VTRRKLPTERNKTGKRLRFTPGDIMRAIAGVEAAGLQVYEVEITSAGAVKISTERVLMPVQMKPSAKVWTRHFRQRTRSRPSGSHISLGRGASDNGTLYD
jgi:hypothetical protein